MEEKQEIQELETNETGLTNPGALLAIAVQKDFDVDRLSKLMELQQRWEEHEARKNYFKAKAAFKKNPPKIIKDMYVEYDTSKGKTQYRHAGLGNIVNVVTPELAKYDLSVGWTTDTKEKIAVTCTLSHIDGFSESTTLDAPPDASGGKNAIQAIGSTITYLERYTLLAILGLSTNEFDDDGKRYGEEPITDEELAKINEWISKIENFNKEKFLEYIGAESIESINRLNYKRAINALKSRAGAK